MEEKEIKMFVELLKNREDVQKITRVEKFKNGIKIYYTMTKKAQKLNELQFRNRVYEYNQNTEVSQDYADVLKVDIEL